MCYIEPNRFPTELPYNSYPYGSDAYNDGYRDGQEARRREYRQSDYDRGYRDGYGGGAYPCHDTLIARWGAQSILDNTMQGDCLSHKVTMG